MRRRKFLAAAASGVAAGCGARGSYRVFSDGEAQTIDALLGWIIPSDDTPGAREAGVIHYIDRQLAGFYREHLPKYREGVAAADRLAGGSFAAASPDRQRDAFQQLQRGETRAFFDLLVTHAMQGFYGNPRHGGNRDFASWRMLGIPPVPVRGREQYDLIKGAPDAKS